MNFELFDVIGITETRLRDLNPRANIDIEGYMNLSIHRLELSVVDLVCI